MAAQRVFRRTGAEAGGYGGDFSGRVAVFQPLDTLRPQHGQASAVHVEVHQGEVRAQPIMVLRDAPVSRLVEAEDALEDAEHVFYFRSYFRLSRVLAACFFVDIVLELGPAAGPVMSVRRCLADRFRLALIAAVAPHLAFLAVQ